MAPLFFNIALAALVWAMPSLAAENPSPLDFKGIYRFEFSGIPIGDLGIEIEQRDAAYAITADVASTGIVKHFTKHSSHTTVDAEKNRVIYETNYRTKNKKRYVKLVYKNGSVAEEKRVPPDNRATRPAVPAALKKDSVDLLTLNLKLRDGVWKALNGGEQNFSVNAYDGRRLMQVDAAVAGKKILREGDKKIPAVRVAVRRTPLAGYTQSEEADYDPNEPTLWLYYSDDERLVPVKIEMGFLFGKITGTLAKECRTGESCLLGIRE